MIWLWATLWFVVGLVAFACVCSGAIVLFAWLTWRREQRQAEKRAWWYDR